MKITKYQYLAYDSSRMYIGTFEDEEYAQRWADKHGGYIDRHDITKEENRVYDDLLKDIVRKETAKEIFIDLLKLKTAQGIIYTFSSEFIKLVERYGVEVKR